MFSGLSRNRALVPCERFEVLNNGPVPCFLNVSKLFGSILGSTIPSRMTFRARKVLENFECPPRRTVSALTRFTQKKKRKAVTEPKSPGTSSGATPRPVVLFSFSINYSSDTD